MKLKDYLLCLCIGALGMTLPFITVGQVDSGYVCRYEWLPGTRVEIPEWVFTERGVGISDPGLRPEIAREQAIQRALLLVALQEGVEVKALCDQFSLFQADVLWERQNARTTVLTQLSTCLREKPYGVVREFYSPYGEAYVQIVPHPDGQRYGICFQGEVLLLDRENQWGDRDLKIHGGTETMALQRVRESRMSLKKEAGRYWYGSEVNGKNLPVRLDCYWYQDAGTDTCTFGSGYSLVNSFWCAEMESLFTALSLYAYSEGILKKVGERYGSQCIELQREVVEARLSVIPRTFQIRENKLYVDWQIRTASEK